MKHKFLLFFILLHITCWAQTRNKAKSGQSATVSYEANLYNGIPWREPSPFRGGRSGTVAGVKSNPNVYDFDSVGGGVWKTYDTCTTWEGITDAYFGGTIGAVAVAESDPNIINVGEGEQTVRSNVSSGWGIWKSTDAGTTWKHIGLRESRHVGRIRIHPKNPDLVYVAAMGDLWKSSDMRGVYAAKIAALPGKTFQINPACPKVPSAL